MRRPVAVEPQRRLREGKVKSQLAYETPKPMKDGSLGGAGDGNRTHIISLGQASNGRFREAVAAFLRDCFWPKVTILGRPLFQGRTCGAPARFVSAGERRIFRCADVRAPRPAGSRTTDPIPGSPMVDAIRARCLPRDDPERMGIIELEVVARVGIEPTTRGFSVRCSTN